MLFFYSFSKFMVPGNRDSRLKTMQAETRSETLTSARKASVTTRQATPEMAIDFCMSGNNSEIVSQLA